MSTYKVPSQRRLDKIIAEFKNGLIKWLAAAGIILILVCTKCSPLLMKH